MRASKALIQAMVDACRCWTIGKRVDVPWGDVLVCEQRHCADFLVDRYSQKHEPWPCFIHAMMQTVKLSNVENTQMFPCWALLEALGIYVLMRLCEEVLKALMIRIKARANKKKANEEKIEERKKQDKMTPPKVVWLSGHGECYHVDANCRGLRATAFVSQRRLCLVCAPIHCRQPETEGQATSPAT